MKTLCRWGGLARASGDPPQEPHDGDAVEGPSDVYDEAPRGELGGLHPSPRSTRRCEGVVVLGSRLASCGPVMIRATTPRANAATNR